MAVEYGGWFMLRVVQVRALVHLVGLTGPLFGISVLLLAAGVYMALTGWIAVGLVSLVLLASLGTALVLAPSEVCSEKRRLLPSSRSLLFHGLDKERRLPNKWKPGNPVLSEDAGRELGKQAKGWRLLFVRRRKENRGGHTETHHKLDITFNRWQVHTILLLASSSCSSPSLGERVVKRSRYRSGLLYDELNALTRTQRFQSVAIFFESELMRDHLIDLHLVTLQMGQGAIETMRLRK